MNYDEFINKQWNLCLTLNLLQTLSGSLSAFELSVGGDSFEFLLEAYDLPDSGCILPHLKALLQFGHWILFILLLHWLLPVPAALSFYCQACETEISCSLGLQVYRNLCFLKHISILMLCVGAVLGRNLLVHHSSILSMTVDSLIGAHYVANGFLLDKGD